MRIVYLVTTAEYFLSHRSRLALKAKAEGHDVWVLANIQDPKQLEQLGFSYQHVPFDRHSMNPISELNVTRKIHQAYKSLQPDICHHVALKPVLYGGLAALILPKPFVINTIAGLGEAFLAIGIKAQIIKRMLFYLFRLIHIPSKRITVFQNQEDQDLWISKKLTPASKAHLIRGSGVDTEKFAPPATNETPNRNENTSQTNMPVRVVLPARMLKTKGVEEFVAAARILKKKIPNCEFILAGRSDMENRSGIPESTLKKYQSEGTVTWLGDVKEMVSLYRSSDIVVLPSYREGLPMSLLEAAACGKPIVGCNEPGMKGLIVDGLNGYLVPSRNSSALADAIENLILDNDLRKEMGKQARALILKTYSADIIDQEYIELYSQCKYESGLK